MHTLRHVEAGIQQQLTDHLQSVERRLEEVARRSEESAFRRAEELFAPQTRDLRVYVEAEIPRLRQRIEEVFNLWQEESEGSRARYKEDFDALQVEVSDLFAEMPSIRSRLVAQTEAIKRLEESPAALRAELSELREESRREDIHLRKEVENETRRAEGHEAANMRTMQERIDSSKALMHAVDERVREQASVAMHNMGAMEKHLLFRVEETRELAAKEARKFIEEASSQERSNANHELKSLLQEKLHECYQNIEVRAAAVESQLRVEIADSVGNLMVRCERTADLRMAEVSLSLSEGLEDARRDLRTQAERQHDMSEKWKEQLEEAMDRLNSVASAARTSCEQVHHHASKQLALASSQLRDDLAKERKAMQKDIAAVRADLDTKVATSEMTKHCDAAKASAETANKKVNVLETHYDGVKAWLERETMSLSERCSSAQSEASDMKQRLHRENTALGNELARMRAAASSLTQGVLCTLQILGLLNEVPQSRDTCRRARFGVDVEDLVEWEKAGFSLADRVSEQWRFSAPASVHTLLELLSQKADHSDVKMMRHQYLFDCGRKSPHKPQTPSTAAGFSETSPFPPVSPEVGRCNSAEGWASLPAVSPSPDMGRFSPFPSDGFVSPFSSSSFFRPSSTPPAPASHVNRML